MPGRFSLQIWLVPTPITDYGSSSVRPDIWVVGLILQFVSGGGQDRPGDAGQVELTGKLATEDLHEDFEGSSV
jgi:hypothetical protein